MCCVIETVKTLIKIVAVVVLLLAVTSIGVGLWAILDKGGPLFTYLGDESWLAIQIIGGLLIGAGAVLAVDFVLACFNSSKVFSGCCLPLLLIFTLVTTLIFVGIGILSLTIMGDMLRFALDASFSYEAKHGVSVDRGPLWSAQKDFDCCGSYQCVSNGTEYLKYACQAPCTQLKGCVDAVTSELLVIFELPLAIGSFIVAAITCVMFVLSLIMCCCP